MRTKMIKTKIKFSSRLLAVILTLVMVCGLMPMTALADKIPSGLPVSYIREVDISDITLPAVGEHPDFYGTLPPNAPYHFASTAELNGMGTPGKVLADICINGVAWKNVNNGKFLASDSRFVEGNTYVFAAVLLPNESPSGLGSKPYVFAKNAIGRINNDVNLVDLIEVDEASGSLQLKSTEFTPIIPVKGITIAPTTKTLTAVGETFQIIPKVVPETAANKMVAFSSSNPAVAKVDPTTGVVTAVANGTATIMVKTYDRGFTAACTVTVNIPSKPAEPSKPASTVKPGQTYQVKTNKYKVITADINGTGTVAFKGSTKDKTKLTSISIPNTVKIDGKTFTVTAIADKAFKNCKKLQKVTIGTTITSIGKSSFSGCIALKTVSGAKNVKTIGTYGFRNCKKLAKITLGTKVTSIGNYCFEGCSVLKAVVVGKNVTTIGKAAFKNCKNLTSIKMKGTKLKKIGANALKGVNAKCRIKVPKSKLKTYKSLFAKKGQAKTVTISK